MTDENTTEQVELGISVSEITEAYDAAYNTYAEQTSSARQTRRDAKEEINKKLASLHESIGVAFGFYTSESDALRMLTNSLYEAKTQDKRDEIAKTYEDAIAQAKDKLNAAKTARDEALAADPFTNFLWTYVREQGFESHANTVLAALPATADELKAIARRNDWCTDFERLMSYAVKRKYIPDPGTFQHIVLVPTWHDIPEQYGASDDETWEIVFTLPAYMRPDSYTFEGLLEYADDVTYRRVDEETAAED